ncbi:PstS family phosphate ABC transporter substrate-binding protein [Gloeobacter morelensis]|nr:PstS family phosphate ABC transporter substrate-binding protein [Gloeobacter morelensis]
MNTQKAAVRCSKCGYNNNPGTAAACLVCGKPLREKAGVPLRVWWIAVAGLLAGGGILFALRAGLDEGVNASTPLAAQIDRYPSRFERIRLYRTMAEVPDVPSGLFNYGGSTTLAPLRSRVILSALAAAHPGFGLRYIDPIDGDPGSGAGIAMLLRGELSFSQSSRPLKDSEFVRAAARGFKLEQLPIAIDGIAVFVHPEVAVEGLNIGQLRDIFTGKITNWRQVGGADLPIVPFSRNLRDGGTVDFFNENVLRSRGFGPRVRAIRDTTEALRNVASTPGGIGYASAPEVISQRTVRTLPLAKGDGRQYVKPFSDLGTVDAGAFRSGTYPITRRLFILVRRDDGLDEQAGAAYTNLLLSGQGQRLVEQAGFVAIR